MNVLTVPPHIDTLPTHDPELAALLDQLAQVVAKMGLNGRVTLGLDHWHFDVSPDEVMSETTDVVGRVHTVRPVRRDSVIAGENYETAWRVAPDGARHCTQICTSLGLGWHDEPAQKDN